MAIPVIDFSKLDGEERGETMAKIANGCEEWGFFQLVNHGIPIELLDRVKEVCSKFYKLEREGGFKDSDPVKLLNKLVESGDDRRLDDLDWEDVILLHDENEWPSNPNDFKETMKEYRVALRNLAKRVMEVMSLNLGLDKDHIKQAFGGDHQPFFGTKVSHYPPCPRPDLVGGLRAHTDAGGVILLFQDDEVSGLQILKDGEWIDVQPLPDSIVINTGDQIEVLSNGKYKSVWHRVLATRGGNRRSIASFYNPSLKSIIAQLDPPKTMEIRLKVVCTSLCRSDLTQWESKAQPDLFPRIFGHEASGIVESVGEGVTEFEVGDHVLTVFIGECQRCKNCVSGKSNMCQVLGLERKGVMHTDKKTRFSIKGRPVYHYCAVSSFSEYTVVHSGCAVKVSPSAPMDRICLLSCGVAAGLGAAWRVADVHKGSTVVIFGLGTVGLSVAQGAHLRGASQVIGVDTNPQKYEKGKTLGVTKYINPDECNEPIQEVIRRMTDGGADYCFECVGDTGMVSTALQSCCDGWGLTVTLGVPKVKVEISTHYALLLSGRTLKGSLFGGWKPKSDLPFLVDKFLNKEIKIDDLVTHDLLFESINRAFELMREGKCLRCVIHMPK